MGSLGRLAAGRTGREVVPVGQRHLGDLRSSHFRTLSVDDWIALLQSGTGIFAQTLQPKIEQIENDFPGLISAAYKGNTAVFALSMVRMLLFSEARLIWRQRANGKPGKTFGSKDLALLERPWPNAVTGDLLNRLILYSDFAGNAYAIRRPGPVVKLPRPDWVSIIIGNVREDADPWDIDNELVGYQYHPGGYGAAEPVSFLPEEVAHFAPIPDPIARYRGMSWMTPAIREIEADSATTMHKLAYFRNGATVNQTVKVESPLIKTPQDFREWIELFEEEHQGASNAYRTLYLIGGTDVTPVGSNLLEADFGRTQAAGEARLAAAAGVPVELVGFASGKQGSSLQSGTYKEAKRRFGDMTMRPLWRNVCGALQTIVQPPDDSSELWYDTSDIAFLAEDAKDSADVSFVKAQAISALVQAGYNPDSVVDAIDSGDNTRLEHSGLYSVQLQRPGSARPSANGDPAPPDGAPASPPASPPAKAAAGDEVRCRTCDRLLAEVATPPYRFTCRCKAVTEMLAPTAAAA